MSETGQRAPSGKPGRYQRTTGGLIGSMIVAVVFVLGIVFLGGFFRDTPEVEVEAVDYLPAVAALQDAGRQVAYPPTLPDGWKATSVDVDRGQRPGWGIGMLTDDGRFLGIRQEDDDVDDLVEQYVDENAADGDPVTAPGALAPEWQTFTDEGGDHGYAATIGTDVGEETLLVYGSAPVEDLERLLLLLTLDPLAPTAR